MRLLYLVRGRLGATVSRFAGEHRRENDVTVIDIGKEQDFGPVLDAIEAAELVISWPRGETGG